MLSALFNGPGSIRRFLYNIACGVGTLVLVAIVALFCVGVTP